MKLRDYQHTAKEQLWDFFRARKGDGKQHNPLLVAPTGSGKSVMIAAIIKDMLERFGGLRVLVVTHQKELIAQNYEKLRITYPTCDAGIYSSSLGRKQTDNKVLFCGIQSIWKKAHDLGDFSLVLVDEAHTIPVKGFGMYQKFLNDLRAICGNVPVVGLTATPYRLDSGYLHTGADAFFTDVAVEIDVNDLLEKGYLCPVTTKATSFIIDTSDVKKRGGEFITGDLEKAVDSVTEAALTDAIKKTEQRKTGLIFCVTVAHAEHVSEFMNNVGKSCAVIHGQTPQKERDRLLNALKHGELDCLANVNCLTTGVDIPNIDYLILLRPTLSPGLFVQMVGRGMRLHDEKINCLVLDYAGNIQRHGPIDRINVIEKGKKEDGECPVKTCPECESIVHAALKVCPECEYEFPPPEPKFKDKASLEAILSKDYEPEWRAVDRLTCTLHKGKDGKHNTMRVDYWNDSGLFPIRVASEFVCVFHPMGYARMKAEQWLYRFGQRGRIDDLQSDLDGNIHVVGDSGASFLDDVINTPSKILIDARGKWAKIIDYDFSNIEETA